MKFAAKARSLRPFAAKFQAPRGLWLLIGPLWLALAAPAMAQAIKGSVSASELSGFGRLIFQFDQEVSTKVRLLNQVMVIEFSGEVVIDLDKLSQQLPNYVSVARLDPGGKSMRLGLVNRFKPDLKPAGEKVFLDLLQPRWVGLPPALPPEVIQDLAKRARAAEEQLRKIERERERLVPRDLTLQTGSTPQFKRVIFGMPMTVPVQYEEADGIVSLRFDARFAIKPELVRAELAGLVQDVEVEPGEASLRISMRPAEGLAVRGFREDDTFTLDFSRQDGKPLDAAAATPESAPPTAKEPPVKISVSGDQIKGAPPAAPPIHAYFEPGKDPNGFALHLAHLNKAPIAIVPRGNALLVLIETPELPSLPTVPEGLARNIESIAVSRVKNGALIQLVPRQEGAFWLSRQGDDLLIQRGKADISPDAYAGAAITLKRAFDSTGKESLEAKVGEGGSLFAIDDPVSGQKLYVVPSPDAAYASDKARAFAEFSIERTLAGFAVLPLDEALTVTRQLELATIGHEIRLNLSALPPEEPSEVRSRKPLLIDPKSWERDSKGATRAGERAFLNAAAESPRVNRSEARLRLARFYLANSLYPEAGGVLSVLAADDLNAAASKSVLFHRALTAALNGHEIEASKLLAEPALSIEPEAKLIQAVVEAQTSRFAQSVASFKQAASELERYPEELQAKFRKLAIEAAIEAQDPAFGRQQLQAFEQLDTQLRNPFVLQLYAARLSEIQGRAGEAFTAYNAAIRSPDRAVEAEARFGRTTSGLADGKVTPEEAKAEFETLTAIWRRSPVEIKALAKLGEIYASEGRWREAFLASQRASSLMPDNPVARRMEDAMGRRFESIFLDNESEKLSKVEALALYQEFQTLIPPGRRGDEIARRLADRLSDLDLVPEAAEILEHQVRNRLDGAARSAVATRLALLHLQARQPLKALSILKETRLANLPKDLRRARNVLEARALGELFRSELAIEVLANEQGDDIDRLRADILWKGKKWREAGESYERVLGDSWQSDEPLTDGQRVDALRAGLAYVLGDEKLSLDRLRSKFLTKMARSEDAGTFNLITVENFSNPQAFRDIARSVVNADTMTEFLASYRRRYPETAGVARPVRSAGDAARQSALPAPAPGPG